MPFWNKYPFTDFHELNLDWIISKVGQIEKNLKETLEAMAKAITAQEKAEEAQEKAEEAQENAETAETNAETAETNTREYYNNLVTHIADDVTGWLDDNVTPVGSTVMLDSSLTIEGAAADAKAAGEIRTELKFVETFDEPFNEIYSNYLESGYYSTNTGEKLDSTSYIRTQILYPISSGVYYSDTGEQIRACLYDEDKNFVSSIYFNAKDSAAHTYIPDNIKYCGIFFSSSHTITDYVRLKRYTGSEYDVIEAPFNGNYYYIPGRWMQGDGTIASSENLALLGIFDPVPGTKYYVGNSADNQCICKDASGQLITVEKTAIPPYGQFFTVPSNAKLVYFNLYANVTYNNTMTNYVAKITDKKVLCIGDSITWLDGHGPYGGTSKLVGYQNTLRKAGFEVWSAGFSGYPYAEGVHESETESLKYSIYNEIVNKNYDVSGYDIIVLAGGLNDMLYNTPIGDRETVYTNRTFDSGTFNGAISGIISYIRTNNPTAKIVICTTPKSEALTRVFARAINYINEIEYNSVFWSAKLCNVFRDMNVQPTYDGFDNYFYDVTHPNNAGMELIGNQLLYSVMTI